MTALASMTSLEPWVSMHVPDAPDNLVTDALKKALNEFFIRAEVWVEEIEIETVEDQADYTLTPTASGAEVHRIDRVRYLNDDEEEECDLHESAYYLNLTNNKLTFETTHIPAEDDRTVRVRTILRPEWRITTANLPLWVLKRWGEKIAAGAVAEIAMLPKRPFTNPQLADYKRREFLSAIGEAKQEELRKGRSVQAGISP